MRPLSSYLKCAVAAFLLQLPLAGGALAQDDELSALFEGLKTADPAAVRQIEGRIYTIWSQSGSDAMDLLLTRGRDAMEQGDTAKAIQHFSALIDHAPDFAEGYNGRATAYFQLGRFGLALEDIRQALLRNPRHFDAMSGLALILEEIDEPVAALDAWLQVEQLHPNREGLLEAKTRLARQVEGTEL